MILKEYELIIFDLDGTLLDTSKGIFNSVRFAESKMGLPSVENEKLVTFIGPPPLNSYMKVYGLSEADAIQATMYHRQYGNEKAIYEAELYPGIIEVLSTLQAYEKKLAVATLKAETAAKAMLFHAGIGKYFDRIIGMDDTESKTKADMLQLAIQSIGTTGEAVLIGDSLYDAEGAEHVGIDFIGAVYGFGIDGKTVYKKITEIRQPIELIL